MKHLFYKYHGTGNDFVLFDNRKQEIKLSTAQIAHLCHRRYGIGADGLMLLEAAEGYDFGMVYYNADGKESTMCGNGGRCITAFAHRLGLISDTARFIAIDGDHTATINADKTISLQMQDVKEIDFEDGYAILDTGSPHYILWVGDVQRTDVFAEGRTIRNFHSFQPDGINVNFVQPDGDKLLVRTYERGVEGETLSCGTGVTASAIAATAEDIGSFNCIVNTPGGELSVSFTKNTATSAQDVILSGPATFVFMGEVAI
jgi:diaminopimelate epimerase